MGKLCVNRHAVACGVYPGNIGFHPAVDYYAAPVVPDAPGLQAEGGSVSPAAYGNQYLFRLNA